MNRLQGKVVLVVGAGQTPGTTIGNGRAVAMRFAAEGACVVAADMDQARAEETAAAIRETGAQCVPVAADITKEDAIKRMVGIALEVYGRIDVLHNNVGAGGALGDAPIADISSDCFDLIHAVNLRGMAMTCKHVLPLMKQQESGVIVNVSSAAAFAVYENIAYKTSKAGVVALTQNIATQYAEYGIRANCILPGLIDTPMAIETRAGGDGERREAVRAARNAAVPLRKQMGTAWDVANAALFLASDEAAFITGVSLPVDGGSLARVGG